MEKERQGEKMYYRVLVSGIPPSMPRGECYDYLKVHHGGASLVNALLLGQQGCTGSSSVATSMSGATAIPALHCGAAIADYSEREAADDCIAHKLVMGGATVAMSLLGVSAQRDDAAESAKTPLRRPIDSCNTGDEMQRPPQEDDMIIGVVGMPSSTSAADVHFFLAHYGIHSLSTKIIAPGQAHVVLPEAAAELLAERAADIRVNGEPIQLAAAKRPMCTEQFQQATPVDLLRAVLEVSQENCRALCDQHGNIYIS